MGVHYTNYLETSGIIYSDGTFKVNKYQIEQVRTEEGKEGVESRERITASNLESLAQNFHENKKLQMGKDAPISSSQTPMKVIPVEGLFVKPATYNGLFVKPATLKELAEFTNFYVKLLRK